MSYEEHKQKSPGYVKCAVVIVSDSRDINTDESGKLLVDGLRNRGHEVPVFEFVGNEGDVIRERLDALLHTDGLQAVITSGGTGASRRDITIETVTPLLDKTLPGFGELFRSLSYGEIGTGAIMSRALAGISWGKVVICLPGSVKAVGLALDRIILPEIGHMVREASR